jgi:hypothetical protein
MKVSYQMMSPCYDILPIVPLVLLNLCQLYVFYDIIELPIFVPNDYLYSNHGDKVPVAGSGNTDAPLASLHSPGRGSVVEDAAGKSDGPSFASKGGDFKPLPQHDEVSPADIEMHIPDHVI